MATTSIATALDAVTPVQIHAAAVGSVLVHGDTDGMAYLGAADVTALTGLPVYPRTTVEVPITVSNSLHAIASKAGYTLRVLRFA